MRGSGLWRWRKPRAGLAFTESTLLALKSPRSSRLRPASGDGTRVEARPLPNGLVEVSPTTPNIQSVRELAELVEDALASIGAHRESLAVALPDLAITTKVFRGRGRASERELRRELSPALPYALGEARCDFWRGRHDEVLAAAIREVVVRQYEQIVETVECRLAWVDGVSLVSIPSRPRGRGLDVDVQLYSGHYSLVVYQGGELVDARTKLRTPGDVDLVCREVLRVPALQGDASGDIDVVRLLGADAATIAVTLEDATQVRAVRVDDDTEQRHLQSSLERLLARGNP